MCIKSELPAKSSAKLEVFGYVVMLKDNNPDDDTLTSYFSSTSYKLNKWYKAVRESSSKHKLSLRLEYPKEIGVPGFHAFAYKSLSDRRFVPYMQSYRAVNDKSVVLVKARFKGLIAYGDDFYGGKVFRAKHRKLLEIVDTKRANYYAYT
jgi:hypothetical protein